MTNNNNQKIVRMLCLLFGFICISLSLIYNEFLISFFNPNSPLEKVTAHGIRYSQIKMFIVGYILVFISVSIKSKFLPLRLQQFINKPVFANMLLTLLFVVLPIGLSEWMLRPFTIDGKTEKTTTIFIKDDDLGWRLKPKTKDYWGDVLVKVNKNGLRGPVVNYKRQDHSIRILYLGDSVTFGYKLKNYYHSFPYVVETNLEKAQHINIETINAGVGGYSPWQHYKYLEKEGIKYDPDIVIVDFSLSDVTEKLELVRFGGAGFGYQLSKSYYSLDDWFKHNSALYNIFDKIRTRIRLGKDPQKGAIKKEQESGKKIAQSTNNDRFKTAWDITLNNLDKINEFCKARNIAIIFVVFPYSFQIDDKRISSTAQQILLSFSKKRGIPCLNLLPLLYDYLKEHDLSSKDLFIDHAHLTPLGNKTVAEMITDFLHDFPGLSHMLMKDVKSEKIRTATSVQ